MESSTKTETQTDEKKKKKINLPGNEDESLINTKTLKITILCSS